MFDVSMNSPYYQMSPGFFSMKFLYIQSQSNTLKNIHLFYLIFKNNASSCLNGSKNDVFVKHKTYCGVYMKRPGL